MKTLNQALEVIDELSINDRLTLFDLLKSMINSNEVEELLNEQNQTLTQFENGSKKLETVEEMFGRLGL